MKAANKHGTIVSYDLNYRPSLWKTIGGLTKAQEVNREIAKYVDVMIGNEEDFTASLGFEVKGQETLGHIETGYTIMFAICAVMYLLAWLVMKSLVPKMKLVEL